MIGISKKGWPILFASLVVVSQVFASGNAVSGEMKPNGCKGPSLCDTRPDVDSNGFMIDIGFILEQVRLTGTMYSYVLGSDVAYDSDVMSANGRRPSFKVDWGVTVGAGYYFEHDSWDIEAQFDWISSTGKNSINTQFDQTVISIDTRLVDAIDGYVGLGASDSGNNKLTVDYYMLDVSLGRGHYMSNNSSIKPHWGIKATWIKYTNKASFMPSPPAPANSIYYYHRIDQFWGVGPAIGVDGMWGLGEGFGIFCDNSLALMVGASSINDHSFSSVNPALYTNTYSEGNIPMMTPAMKIFLGLQYAKSVYYGQQNIRLRAGWDSSFYFNQYAHSYILNLPEDIPRFATVENGTFGLTGFRFDLNWEF